jgi:hypothetical protein
VELNLTNYIGRDLVHEKILLSENEILSLDIELTESLDENADDKEKNNSDREIRIGLLRR